MYHHPNIKCSCKSLLKKKENQFKKMHWQNNKHIYRHAHTQRVTHKNMKILIILLSSRHVCNCIVSEVISYFWCFLCCSWVPRRVKHIVVMMMIAYRNTKTKMKRILEYFNFICFSIWVIHNNLMYFMYIVGIHKTIWDFFQYHFKTKCKRAELKSVLYI